MELYVARCGETDSAMNRMAIGRTNEHLNDIGRRQAERLAQQLSNESLTCVYTSPLIRAFSTGMEICVEQQSETCTMQSADALSDINLGDLEHVSQENVELLCHKSQMLQRFPNGESVLDVVGRVYPFLTDLKVKHGVNDKVLLVTHDIVCRVIRSYFENLTFEDFRCMYTAFCGVVIYEM